MILRIPDASVIEISLVEARFHQKTVQISEVDQSRRTPSRTRSGAAVAIVALMVVGSVSLWIGSPALWLWLTSRLQSGTQASMGPYLLLIVGVVVTSVVLAKGLAKLNRVYSTVTGTAGTVVIHRPWHRMRGAEHESRALETTVLDVVMVTSVVVALVALAVWFLVVHPTPPGLEPGPAKH
jgi:hypothetical protein